MTAPTQNRDYSEGYDNGYRAGLQRACDLGFNIHHAVDEMLTLTGDVLDSHYARGQIDIIVTLFKTTTETVERVIASKMDQSITD